MERVSRDSIGPKAFAGKRGAQAVPAGWGRERGNMGGSPFLQKVSPPRFFIPQSSPSKHPSPRQCPPGSCRPPQPDRGVRRRSRQWARQLPRSGAGAVKRPCRSLETYRIMLTLPSSTGAAMQATPEGVFGADVVHELAHGLDVAGVEFRGKHLHAVDLHDLGHEIPALPGRGLRGGLFQILAEPAGFLSRRPSSLATSPPGCVLSMAASWCSSSLMARACLRAFQPVAASMRRVPAAMPLSDRMTKLPAWPVLCRCVPPQSSRRTRCNPGLPMVTTRTVSPYFSPNRRHSAHVDGGLLAHELGGQRVVGHDRGVHVAFHGGQLFRGHGRDVREVEAQCDPA